MKKLFWKPNATRIGIRIRIGIGIYNNNNNNNNIVVLIGISTTNKIINCRF